MAAVCVFCASSRTLEQRWLDLAAEVGRAIAARGHTLVSGGGRVGMMGAVAAGARSAGGHTIGVIPQSLVDLEIADRDAGELLVTADMASRKTLMMARSDAFLTLPGGLGTLDELFEVWTTATLGLHHKPVVLVDSDNFFAGLVSWLRRLPTAGFAHQAGVERVVVVDSVAAALGVIDAALLAVPDRVRCHTDLFNAAVRDGDWSTFVSTFDEQAVMRFVGVPAGPFHGRAAIARAYAERPPTDTLTVTSATVEDRADVLRFAWDKGGTGTMTLRWRGGRVLDLTVAFD